MDLILDKTTCSFGDMIHGKASLQVNVPVKARGVFVYFYGLEETRVQRNGKWETNSHTVNRIELKLEECEKDYSSKEYEFDLGIPPYSLKNYSIGFLSGESKTIKWFVEAKLDIPLGFDVSKKIQLNIV